MDNSVGENKNSQNLGSDKTSNKSKNEKLKALLDGLDLTPEQTRDDIAPKQDSSRDSEILRDVPPHHG